MFRGGKIPDITGCGYEPPIEILTDELNTRLEDGVMTAVQKVCINVDKEELIKMIKGEREQYSKGYSNGYAQGYEDGIAETMRKLKEYIGGTE